MRGILSSPNLLPLTGHLTRRERLSFWEMTVYHVSMTHGDTNTHRPPGSSSISQSQRHVFPSSRNADILTLGRTKVETQAAFSKGFPLYGPDCQNTQPDSSFAMTFSAVTWRKITETKHSGKCDAFMCTDGACTNPRCYNAICV